MQCDCLNKINTALKPNNTALSVVALMNMETGATRECLVIKTERRSSSDKRSRVITVTPTFCPFCGVAVRRSADKAAA